VSRDDAERTALLGYLRAQRARVHAVLAGLDERALRRPALPPGWTCRDLVHHLTAEERLWLRGIAAGQPVPLPESPADDEAEWRAPAGASTADLLERYRAECARCDEALTALSLDEAPRRWFARWPHWRVPDVRWVVLHVVEETARHLGHLDAARELLDGRTGLAPDATAY
jgi:uncharacterized protein (TIGR03083 family)